MFTRVHTRTLIQNSLRTCHPGEVPVTTTSPEVTDPASFRDQLFPSSVHKGQAGMTRPQLHPGVANQNPFLGLSLEVLGNRHLSQVVVQGQELRLELTAALYHARGEPTRRGHQPRIKGAQRLEEVCLDSSSGSLQIQLFLKPALPCTSQFKWPIASPWAGVSFN